MEEALSFRGGVWAPFWKAALLKEVGALDRKNTHTDPCTPTTKVISTRWAFRVTRNANNSFKFKIRLVEKGYMQRPGVKFTESISSVCSTKAITTLLSISASEDIEFRTYDVGAAYLEAHIDTITLIKLPPSHPTLPNAIVQLKKSLYGLASSGLNWNKTKQHVPSRTHASTYFPSPIPTALSTSTSTWTTSLPQVPTP